MVLLNIYGIIKPIILSSKIGIGISNLPSDWIEGIQDDFEEEIIIRQKDIESNKKYVDKYGWDELPQYNCSEIVKKAGWNLEKEYYKTDKRIIAEHLIYLDIFNFKKSYLKLKNSFMDSPTCEKEYPEKFINFCNFLQRAYSAESILKRGLPFCIYSDSLDKEKPLILNFISSIIKLTNDIEDYTKCCIKSLKKIGNIIDNFLITDENFWMFDYLINAISVDNNYDAYHIFKNMSLIEMLIVKPNKKSKDEIETKLPLFMKTNSVNINSQKSFAEIVRQLRNKIGHGDFKAVHKLLSRYRNEIVPNYNYDECEYSIENWNYLSICCELDNILSEIIWTLLTDNKKLKEIQFS